MDFLTEFIKSKKDLIAKSPEGYEYEIEIRLKDVTEKEFTRLPKVNNIITIEETLYSVKEVVLSLERRHHKEEGMALRIKRNKERSVIRYNKFKIDSTRVISKAHTHYEIELELLDDDCEIKLLELALECIRLSTVPQIFKLINKLVPSLDLRSYKLPKPVDITVKELARNYSSGGSVSLKLDGTRSFLACYEATMYAISTKGEETIIESGVRDCNLLTLFDTEAVSDVYYAFDIIILDGVVVGNKPLIERVRMIPQAYLAINKATKKRLVVAKTHFMFKTFSAFSRHHQILEKQIQESKYDGLIYTHSQSYLDPVMRWKPQKTVDLLYQEKALMAYNKKENVDSGLKISQNSTEPKENAISEFIINPNRTVTLLREREDKVYPNRVAVVEKIKKIAREEKNMFNVLKGLTVSMMRSYHNEVKRDLLKKGAGHLLDVGSGFGGDITKWDHYKSVTCVDPSYSNIKELKKRLGTNKKVRVIQTRIEHLRGFEKSITTLSCFFCITLIDIDKLIRIAQRTFSDKHKCAFLCIVMSKKYIIEFFEARKKHHLLLLQALIIMDTRHKILTLTPMLLSRAPKKVYSSPAQESHKYFSQKVEEIDTSEVFTYTPEKVLSKEKIKYVVSRTVNRNMLVAIDLLKQLKNTNNISNISSADFEALITKPLDKFLDGRVVKKQQERANPFDTPRDVT
uniref:Methyltransferase type 11 domain-containing protein n=1 Tax=Physcomitrium patens TaxID=3218 RepID=A0A7I4EH83_PHYPA